MLLKQSKYTGFTLANTNEIGIIFHEIQANTATNEMNTIPSHALIRDTNASTLLWKVRLNEMTTRIDVIIRGAEYFKHKSNDRHESQIYVNYVNSLLGTLTMAQTNTASRH